MLRVFAGMLRSNWPIRHCSTDTGVAHFILVHGAWHGGWCWEELVPRLTARGHSVAAPDLPGMGQDAGSGHVATLQEWAMFVAGLAAGAPEPAILVGHSRGGMVISQAAEFAAKGSVDHLVYLAAAMPLPGESLAQIFDARALSAMVSLMDGLATSADGRELILHGEAEAIAAYYGTTPLGKARAAFGRFCPEPHAMRTARAMLTRDRYGAIARSYICCEQDQGVVPALQRQMVARQPCPTYSLDTDHSPFYSAPDALVAILDRIAAGEQVRARIGGHG